MNGTNCEANTPIGHVYLPAARVLALLQSLQRANQPPHDQVAALCGVVDFLDAVPAIRASGITQPLHQLLAALPNLLRIAASRNDVIEKLASAHEKLDDPAADAPMVRGEALRDTIAFFDADDAVLRQGLTRPLKQILAAMHDRRQQQWGNRPTGLVDHHLRGVILYVTAEINRLGVARMDTAGRVAERLEKSGAHNPDGSRITNAQLLRWQRDLRKQPRLTRDVYDALCRERPAEAAQGTDEAVIEGLLAMLCAVRNWS